MSTFFTVLLVILAVVVIWAISGYNTLIRMIEAVRNNEKQIDIQLDRRFKVFESLINVVKKAMNYEQTTLKDVVALRNKAQAAHAAGDETTRIAAENEISKIAGGINLVFEQYPELKANQNALQLQEEIVNTENKLSYAKQAYNDSVEKYEAKKKSFFESFLVKFFSAALDKTFPYWQLAKEEITKQEAYTVNLND